MWKKGFLSSRSLLFYPITFSAIFRKLPPIIFSISRSDNTCLYNYPFCLSNREINILLISQFIDLLAQSNQYQSQRSQLGQAYRFEAQVLFVLSM